MYCPSDLPEDIEAVEEMLFEILQSPEGAAAAGTLALVAAAPPPLPTFVPQGTPPPTPGGGVGGGGTGGGGGGSVASGGGVLPGFALAVIIYFRCFGWFYKTLYRFYGIIFLLST